MGPEGPETPVNGGSGRNNSGWNDTAHANNKRIETLRRKRNQIKPNDERKGYVEVRWPEVSSTSKNKLRAHPRPVKNIKEQIGNLKTRIETHLFPFVPHPFQVQSVNFVSSPLLL